MSYENRVTKFSVFVSSVWHGKRMNYFRSLVAPFLNKYLWLFFNDSLTNE